MIVNVKVGDLVYFRREVVSAWKSLDWCEEDANLTQGRWRIVKGVVESIEEANCECSSLLTVSFMEGSKITKECFPCSVISEGEMVALTLSKRRLTKGGRKKIRCTRNCQYYKYPDRDEK